MVRAKRTDNNHADFTRLFRHLDYKFLDVHAFPGLGDFLVSTRRKTPVFFEVKSSEGAKLTEAEERLRGMFPLNFYRVDTPQDAADILAELDMEDE